MSRCVITLAALLIPSVAAADMPRNAIHPMRSPVAVPNLVNSHILYLNRCKSGCVVHSGATDSRTDHSDIGSGTLTAFSESDATWTSVVNCVKSVMMPFNIQVTDVDPGSTVDHFEVMIAGSPNQIGLPSSVGGIADFPCIGPGQCDAYLPNALVFDFEQVWGGNVTYICGTAAQEIAHAWTLDHTIYNNDPMTYNGYSSPLMYRDNAMCGSDCGYSCPGGGGNCNAFGLTCSGSGGQATHICEPSGTATQNEIQIIKGIFGPYGAKDPTVTITSPSDGGAEQVNQPFSVTAMCTSNDSATITEVDLAVDGVAKATLTTNPATFTVQGTLPEGTHKIKVTCGTTNLAIGSKEISVIVGTLCSTDTDCPMNDICYQSACIVGPDGAGGLGAPCNNNGDCKSGSCANDGTESLCVVPCDVNNDHCPNGFGCISAGTSGVCWFGAENGGGGCCDTGGDARGSILLGLVFAATLITPRSRRKRV
jgi:hypothetical protein